MSGRIFDIQDPPASPVALDEAAVERSSSPQTIRIALIGGIIIIFAGLAIWLAVAVGPAKPDPSIARPTPAASSTPAVDAGGVAMTAFIIIVYLVLVVIGMALYFLPTIVAANRGHHNVATIAVLNIFLGWTFVGWVVSLAMAVSEVRKPLASSHH